MESPIKRACILERWLCLTMERQLIFCQPFFATFFLAWPSFDNRVTEMEATKADEKLFFCHLNIFQECVLPNLLASSVHSRRPFRMLDFSNRSMSECLHSISWIKLEQVEGLFHHNSQKKLLLGASLQWEEADGVFLQSSYIGAWLRE